MQYYKTRSKVLEHSVEDRGIGKLKKWRNDDSFFVANKEWFILWAEFLLSAYETF